MMREYYKYLQLCYTDEQKSYGFRKTRGWVNDETISIFEWIIPLTKIRKAVGCAQQIWCMWPEKYSKYIQNDNSFPDKNGNYLVLCVSVFVYVW